MPHRFEHRRTGRDPQYFEIWLDSCTPVAPSELLSCLPRPDEPHRNRGRVMGSICTPCNPVGPGSARAITAKIARSGIARIPTATIWVQNGKIMGFVAGGGANRSNRPVFFLPRVPFRRSDPFVCKQLEAKHDYASREPSPPTAPADFARFSLSAYTQGRERR